MPEGISVIVDDEGFANITFENPLLRGPALDKLIKLGGAETVEKSTENGYPSYRVPEGNARAAGLLVSTVPGKTRVDVTVDSAELKEKVAEAVGQTTGTPAAQAVHVAADGTETPLTPDTDGLVTLVSDGPAADGIQTPANVDDPATVPADPPADPNEPPADTGTQPAPAPKEDPGYPEGDPSDDWSLAELKAYASVKGLDAHELRSKAKVLALINGK